MKKLSLVLAIALIFTVVFSTNGFALNIGDKLGDVLYTDIKAYIDGYRIPCYTVDGNIVVMLNDLRSYGFDTAWDGKARTTTITLNRWKPFSPIKAEDNDKPVGSVAFTHIYSDIKVQSGMGWTIDSYNINGNVYVVLSALTETGSRKGNSSTVYCIRDDEAKSIKLFTNNQIENQYRKTFEQSVLTKGNVKPTIKYSNQDKLYCYDATSTPEPSDTFIRWTNDYSTFDNTNLLSHSSKTPNDVGGIIILNREKTIGARYYGGYLGYTVNYTIEIFDPYKGIVVDTKKFYGGKSFPYATNGRDIYNVPNAGEMLWWTESTWRAYLHAE